MDHCEVHVAGTLTNYTFDMSAQPQIARCTLSLALPAMITLKSPQWHYETSKLTRLVVQDYSTEG